VTDNTGLADRRPGPVPEALQTLAEYLEQSLDNAANIVMMRHPDDVCTVYLGDPSGQREDLRQIASIDVSLANDMLESTQSGANQMAIGGQDYRFVRSFTAVGDTAAIVFSTD
jgi:hypothetical protein